MATDVHHTPATLATVNGMQLCYEAFGDPVAPPLLLIMGLGAQMIAWDDDFCIGLAERGFRVIRFDNRDIGKSARLDKAGLPNVMAMMGQLALGRTVTAPYLLKDMAADTVALLDHLGIAHAHFVGASMGGAIAQDIAIHFPTRLTSLTCIFATTGASNLPKPTAEAIAVLLSPAPLTRDAYVDHHIKSARVLRGPNYPEENAFDEARGRRNFDRGLNPPGVTRQLAAIFASGDRTKALQSITAPTLVIHGDADPLVHVDCGHAIVKAVGRASVDIIRGMGHSLPRREWPRIIDAIARHAR